MAALALPLTRTVARSWWTSRFSFGLGALSSAPAVGGLALALPSLRTLVELFPPIVLAVPKKKTSHSRKAMRSANKGLKDKTNIVNCPGCGSAKRAHHICPECYSQVNRAWKAQNRQPPVEVSL
ncbi:hypothetical protein BDV93DRAFT_471094 [Ceratobasidium sp. AG-I]|nr:hypothetical protein BDV93DRAFT_471094 [Ceratobasidium sp. AG-I]